MKMSRNVPLWYKIESFLISNKVTRPLLFQVHRVRKKVYRLRELWQTKNRPDNLRNFERKVCSQNGEDGILEEIFRRIGTTDRFFVEFGVQDGTQCCTRHLLENAKWSGVWFECSQDLVDSARNAFKRMQVTIVNRFLTAENIVDEFKAAKVPSTFDLLVIDVDGNDYWMWKALAEHYRPRVVVTEYNATFGPRKAWVMPYDPQHRYDETAYFGASLGAFADFARLQGYSLISCDSQGVNAFFVRNDVAAGVFDGVDKPAAYHYVAPHYDWWFGHPVERFD